MNIAGMEVYFASDLKDYGRTEDGTPFIGYTYFVEVEDKRGNRWRHNRYFDGVRKELYEEGTAYLDNRPNACAHCELMVAAIKERGKIDLQYWHRASPAYGSDAYIEYGQAEELAWERQSIGDEQT